MTTQNNAVTAADLNANNSSRPTRKVTTATTLTREIHDRLITCSECGGRNGSHKANQPCDFCGMFLNVRLSPDHERYIRGLDTTASGRDTYDIGDLTADTLRGMTVSEVTEATSQALAGMPVEIAMSVKIGRQFKKSGFSWTAEGVEEWLEERYEGRNNGMIRMNCGNLLRSATKRNEIAAQTI